MIAALLAAGTSSRFGSCKQLALFQNKPLIDHAFESIPNRVEKILVTGAYRAELETWAEPHSILCLYNAEFSRGIGSSIKLAAKHAAKVDEDLLLMLTDTPLVKLNHLEKLASQFRDKPIFSDFKNALGPPAIIPKAFVQELFNLPDSKGAKFLFDDFDTCEFNQCYEDVDTTADLVQMHLQF
tara:strand:- start:99 stop:647 length:549 start_codon:yes stop_codon:yes gene_type:complete